MVGLKPLILAVVLAESSGNPKAVSPANARGCMQLTDIAVKQTQVDTKVPRYTPNLFDPKVNIWYGTKYLEYCQGRTNNLSEALMCYNGGMRQVYRHRKGLKLAPETERYYRKVLLYRSLFLGEYE